MPPVTRLTPDPSAATCPSCGLLELVGDKWTLLLSPKLAEGPERNGELLRALEGVSQKMLTQTLKRLVDHRLVERRDSAEVPPRVDYRLTELGRPLGALLSHVDAWVVAPYGDTVDD